MRNEGTQENFLKFIDAYSRRVPDAIQGEYGAQFVSRLLPSVFLLNPGDERCIALQEDFIRRTAESPSVAVQKVGISFKERVYFEPGRLQSLVDGVKSVGDLAMPDVEKLFDRLKQHPDVSTYVFQGCLAIVGALVETKNIPSAENAIGKLREIEPSIVDAKNRQLISHFLSKFEKDVEFLRSSIDAASEPGAE